MQKFIKQKKIEFYNAKLTENIGKPKELWKALKNLGLPSKKSLSTNICLTKDNTTIFADKENTNIFKKFYSTLADDLVKNCLQLHLFLVYRRCVNTTIKH